MPFTVQNSEELTEKIAVRVTRTEKAHLRENARLAGLSVSALVRRGCFGRKVIADLDLATIRELRRIGSLLKHLHNENRGLYREETAVALRELTCAISRLNRDR
ncbi:MAG: MobB mobilization protein [Candidatus Contendobacter sp.]|jgi:hypothetical protein|nr:MobB mobilization protein [Candidatus Contendobacter sp.]